MIAAAECGASFIGLVPGVGCGVSIRLGVSGAVTNDCVTKLSAF